ncbi:hypothetical protein CERZMDRAFT_95824 [Cercospora zeae-maydis SCOH1-5]|uniref:BTB domain-containing protein n=1 Tax=Cercospora zeae-maydis SCOH1-5 TaxID=717836 RepID=A0A6A6FK15_9PEZI|nr:hypothetical protein CERZMDRAFT_95824 [Cercospora zeae-maydis SCOH1-5]
MTEPLPPCRPHRFPNIEFTAAAVQGLCRITVTFDGDVADHTGSQLWQRAFERPICVRIHPLSTASLSAKELSDNGRRLHLNGKFSDLTITCNDKRWAVHKAIVCSRSGFFDGACSHQFREANSGVIDLSEDDEDAVEQMIHYLYHLDYLNEELQQRPAEMFRHRAYTNHKPTPKKIDFSHIEDPLLAQAGFYDQASSPSRSRTDSACSKQPPTTTSSHRPDTPQQGSQFKGEGEHAEDNDDTEAESHPVLHTQIYALGEKYDIQPLKQLARRKFEMAAACYYDAPELADAIRLVYQSTVDTDRGLRDIVLQLFRRHPQLANTQDIYAVIKETPDLALDLWKVERGLL